MDDHVRNLNRDLRHTQQQLVVLRERLRVQANTILRLRAFAAAHDLVAEHDHIVTQERERER